MSAIADIFTGGGRAEAAARDAAQQVQFQPFNINAGPLGRVYGGGRNLNVMQGAQGERLSPQLLRGFESFLSGGLGGGAMGPAGANLRALDEALGGIQAPGPTIGVSQLQPTIGDFSALTRAGTGALGASEAAREALGDFDPDAFAGRQFERLEALSAPQEATAANQLLERLYGTGRLGVQEGGRQRELTELAIAQESARNQRALQALGLAGQEQQRLASQAGLFGQLGAGLLGQSFDVQQGRFGQNLAAEQLRSQQQQQLFSQLLSGAGFGADIAGRRFDAAQGALGFGQQQQAQDIGLALSLLQGLQSQQQAPFALLGQSIGAGAADLQAAQARAGMIADAARNRATANAGFFSGILGAAGSIFTGPFGGGG